MWVQFRRHYRALRALPRELRIRWKLSSWWVIPLAAATHLRDLLRAPAAPSWIMPDPQETALLRAVLGERQAWDQVEDDLEEQLRQRPWLRRLAPHLNWARPSDRPGGSEALRLAGLYEPMRWQAYRQKVEQVLALLASQGARLRLPRGPVLEDQYYPQPGLRHSHDLDLIVDPADLCLARTALLQAGYRDEGACLVHADGMPVRLHTQPFGLPIYRLPDHAWRRQSFYGVEVEVLSPAGLFVLLAGHVASQSVGLHWVVDAWHVQANWALDWREVEVLAQAGGITLPCLAVLDYLVSLGARVPDWLLAGLQEKAATMPATQSGWPARLDRLRWQWRQYAARFA